LDGYATKAKKSPGTRIEADNAVLKFDFSTNFDIIFFYKKIITSTVLIRNPDAVTIFSPYRKFSKQYILRKDDKNDSK